MSVILPFVWYRKIMLYVWATVIYVEWSMMMIQFEFSKKKKPHMNIEWRSRSKRIVTEIHWRRVTPFITYDNLFTAFSIEWAICIWYDICDECVTCVALSVHSCAKKKETKIEKEMIRLHGVVVLKRFLLLLLFFVGYVRSLFGAIVIYNWPAVGIYYFCDLTIFFSFSDTHTHINTEKWRRNPVKKKTIKQKFISKYRRAPFAIHCESPH